jgi:predicted DNA binding protein
VVSVIAEFEAAAPFGGEALARAPGTRLVREETDLTVQDGLRLVCWAEGDDLDALEAGLAAEPTVTAVDRLLDAGGRRLYAVRVGIPPSESVYATVVDNDVQILHLEHDADGVFARLRCPSREAFVAVKRAWEERYGEFRTCAIHGERGGPERPLSAKQRETLALALDRGYFEVPRRVTLGDLAEDLGVSDTAVSQRIRRGCRTLVREACPDRG